jgi:hypothetical protein
LHPRSCPCVWQDEAVAYLEEPFYTYIKHVIGFGAGEDFERERQSALKKKIADAAAAAEAKPSS